MAQTIAHIKQQPGNRRPKFKVGDKVQLIFMSHPVEGRVVEDRGTIGIGGNRLYRVETQTDSITRILELPAEELTPVQ